MKKITKTILSVLCVGATAVGGMGGYAKASAQAENDPLAFSSAIRAVTPYDGEKVDTNTTEIAAWWASEDVNAETLNGLYEYTSSHRAFNSLVGDTSEEGVAKLVKTYNETDAFHPVNNVLKWTDDLENVQSYTVRIALDNKFTKTVQRVENVDKDEGVVVENPLTDTEYYWQVIANGENGGKTYSPIFSFETTAAVRTIYVEGVSNTRDVGGFEGAYGYVQQGLVYRSSRLETTSESGKATLKKLGVKSDLDLRGESEASGGANKKDPLNFGDEHYFVFDTPQYSAIGNEEYFANVKNIMSVFADKNNYPIDVHCAIGRDRTGTICALLKALVGCDEASIQKDYLTSAFATASAWGKSSSKDFVNNVNSILSYLNTFNGETLADRTAKYLIDKCGMTQDQIDCIRKIMTGAEGYEVETTATFKDEDNYEGYTFVSFKQYGVKTQTIALQKGEKAVAPYALADGYEWTLDGETFDFETAIDKDVTLTATKAEYCTVKVYSVTDGTEKTLQVKKGAAVDFAELQKDGYRVTVITQDGKTVTEYTVTQDCVLNVVYTK